MNNIKIDSQTFFKITSFLFNMIQLVFIMMIYACPASVYVVNATNIIFCLFNIAINKYAKQKNHTEIFSLTSYIILFILLIIAPYLTK